jgi:hypothetical protein
VPERHCRFTCPASIPNIQLRNGGSLAIASCGADRALDLRFGFETDADRPALERLAARLREASAPTANWPLRFAWNRLPGLHGGDDQFPVRRRRFLARDGSEVRGAVNILESELSLSARSGMTSFAWSNGLFSESVVDRRYSSVPVALMRAALAQQPRQMNLGPIGTLDAMPRLFIALHWWYAPVAVLMLPLRTARVAHDLRRLSRYPRLQATAQLAATVRLTSLVDFGLAAWRLGRRPRSVHIDDVNQFSGWADEVWMATRSSYAALVRRDGAALDRQYRAGDTRLTRIRISVGARPLGWMAVTIRENRDDPDYGNLRVGVLADCLSEPRDAAAVLMAGVERLAEEGVDLIRATFSHSAWIAAARRTGFVPVPTTTRFFASPPMASLLPPLSDIHLTLGDNDGPLPYNALIDEQAIQEARP